MNKRFTASRVPDSGIEELFRSEQRWQAWLAVESALALSQADLGMIPHEAADAIKAECRIERLDLGRIREGIARTSHPLMPLIIELSRVVGEPHGGWVHWGCYHPKHHSDRPWPTLASGVRRWSWPDVHMVSMQSPSPSA